jgi:hypothetical protein
MFLVTWTQTVKELAPYKEGYYIMMDCKMHEIVDTAQELAEYERYQDVKFFEVTKQVFPKFTTVLKVEF